MPNGTGAPATVGATNGNGSGLEPTLQALQRSIATQLGQDPRIDLGFMLALAREELDDRMSSEQRQRTRAQKESEGAMGPIDQLLALSRTLQQPQGPQLQPGGAMAMQQLAGGAPQPSPLGSGLPGPIGGGGAQPNPLAGALGPGAAPPGMAAGIGAAQPGGGGIPPQLLALLRATRGLA